MIDVKKYDLSEDNLNRIADAMNSDITPSKELMEEATVVAAIKASGVNVDLLTKPQEIELFNQLIDIIVDYPALHTALLKKDIKKMRGSNDDKIERP